MTAALNINSLPKPPLVGVGLYSIPEAARYLDEPLYSLNRWAAGYTFKRDGERRSMSPVLHRSDPALVRQRVLTFLDMVELKVVALLRDCGVPLPKIRSAGELAAERLELSHPFATRDLFTNGWRFFHRWGLDFPGTVLELHSGQVAMEEAAGPFLEFSEQLDFSDQLAERYYPLGSESGVVLDPARCFGRPIIEAFGVPTRVLYEMVRGGSEPKRVADWYEVDERAVEQAVRFEKALRGL